jgi:hypothetical protein
MKGAPQSASQAHKRTKKIAIELTDRQRSQIEVIRNAMSRFLKANYGAKADHSTSQTFIGMTPREVYLLMIAESLLGSPPLFANVAQCAGVDWTFGYPELAVMGQVRTIQLSQAKVVRQYFMTERGWKFEEVIKHSLFLLYKLSRNVDAATVLTDSPRHVANRMTDAELQAKLGSALGMDRNDEIDDWLLTNGFRSDRILDVFQRIGASITMTELLFFEEAIQRFAPQHSLAGTSDSSAPRRIGQAIVALSELVLGKKVDYERGYIPVANPELFERLNKLNAVIGSRVDSGLRPLHNSQFKPSEEQLTKLVKAGTKIKLAPSGATSRFLKDLGESQNLGDDK